MVLKLGGGAGGGLVAHPPQGAFAERDVAALQQPLDLGLAGGFGVVDMFAAAFGVGRDGRRGPMVRSMTEA